MLARLAVALIRLYQRWISPYKGYRCAHRALHGGPSCSEFGIAVAQSDGVLSLWPSLRARFAECRAAAATIRAMRSQVAHDDDSDNGSSVEDDQSDEQSNQSRKKRGEAGDRPWLDSLGCGAEACICAGIGADFGGDGCGGCGFDGCG